MQPIYLDHNATTPVDPGVLDAMLPFLQGEFGNPSSAYALGKRAHDAIENARAQVAALIGAEPDEIVFLSGGTEASNIAIRSGAKNGARRAIVTSNIEHPATDACCTLLARDGYEIRRVRASHDGIVSATGFDRLIDPSTALVTLIHAQNEIGTLQPVSEVAAIAKARGALMHADAAQSVGKVAVDVKTMGVDLLSIAGHKLYAPKGVGALFVRRGVDVPSVLVGAGQEHGRRPGTENVAFIAGFGEACRIARAQLDAASTHTGQVAQALLRQLQKEIPGLVLTGHAEQRLPNTLNVLFPGVSGRQLLQNCPQVMASNGSACHAEREDASAILTGIGIDERQALGAVRLSAGRKTTIKDAEAAATALAQAWRSLRSQQETPLAAAGARR